MGSSSSKIYISHNPLITIDCQEDYIGNSPLCIEFSMDLWKQLNLYQQQILMTYGIT